MNIQILNPDKFISLNKRIYIIHENYISLPDNILVWKGDDESPININTEMALSPLDLEIEMYLQNDDGLRELALELDLIYIRDIDTINYLNYCNSY